MLDRLLIYISLPLILLNLCSECIAQKLVPGEHSRLVRAEDSIAHYFTGVGRLQQNHGCTGVLIGCTDEAGTPAYMVTNGHCVQDWKSNEIFGDVPLDEYYAIFNFFVDGQVAFDTVQVEKIVYSTMKGVDLAIVVLVENLDTLINRGITPMKPATQPVAEGTPITVVGIPGGDIAANESYLRTIDCSITGQADLAEWMWHFNDVYQTNCLDIYGGASGSPVVIRNEAATFFALVNTTTINGQYPCSMGAPCELDSVEARLNPNTSYLIPVDGLCNCFDEQGILDLSLPKCPLPTTNSMLPENEIYDALPTFTLDSTEIFNRTHLNVKLRGEYLYYRYKITPGPVDGRTTEEGFSSIRRLDQQPAIDAPVPEEEGLYRLYVQGGHHQDTKSKWQPLSEATVINFTVDNTPPSAKPQYEVSYGSDSTTVELIYQRPEYNNFYYALSNHKTQNQPEGFFQKYHWRTPIKVANTQLPIQIAVRVADQAGNEGPLHQLTIFSESQP